MATSNQYQATTIQLTENLSAVTAQYHAVAFNDGQLAASAEEASGILMDKCPAQYDHVNVAVSGEIKFAAGGTITQGDKLTVTTSGWFTTAGSDDGIVGEAKYATTSGSIGTGLFNFAGNTDGQQKGLVYDVTAADAIGAGFAYCLADHKLANNGDEHSGCATSAISSGAAGQIMVCGIASVIMGGGTVTKGTKLTVTTSGYYVATDSGYWIVGQALATSTASGTRGEAFIYAGNVKETL